MAPKLKPLPEHIARNRAIRRAGKNGVRLAVVEVLAEDHFVVVLTEELGERRPKLGDRLYAIFARES